MKNKFNRNYFINKFDKIPDEMFTTLKWGRLDKKEPTCATGHCGFDNVNYNDPTDENSALIRLFEDIELRDKETGDRIHDNDRSGRFSWKVVWINDGKVAKYQQETPKLRILAALNDLPE